MKSIKPRLEQSKQQLAAVTFQPRWDLIGIATHLESLSEMLLCVGKDQYRELIADFHDSAGKLPYIDDEDYGALVLESAAEIITDSELRLWVLTEARIRATWCVRGATAGGEAISRASHLNRLDEKIRLSF